MNEDEQEVSTSEQCVDMGVRMIRKGLEAAYGEGRRSSNSEHREIEMLKEQLSNRDSVIQQLRNANWALEVRLGSRGGKCQCKQSQAARPADAVVMSDAHDYNADSATQDDVLRIESVLHERIDLIVRQFDESLVSLHEAYEKQSEEFKDHKSWVERTCKSLALALGELSRSRKADPDVDYALRVSSVMEDWVCNRETMPDAMAKIADIHAKRFH